MRCVVGQSWDGKQCVGDASSFTWDEAQLVQHSFAGFSDWRLPDADELSSFAWSPEPTLNKGELVFPDLRLNLWSSTLYKGVDGYSANQGGAAFLTDRSSKLALRLVRRAPSWVAVGNPNIPEAPVEPITSQLAEYFTDHGDGTLTDKRTGLMWMRSALGITWEAKPTEKREFAATFTWEAACVIGHFFAGHADWRVPTVDELISLIDLSQYDPAIDSVAFPNSPSGSFWTCSSSAGDRACVWHVDFFTGSAHTTSTPSLHFPVRLVRRSLSLSAPEQKLIDNQDGTVSDVSSGLMWMGCAIGQIWNGKEFIGEPQSCKWDDVDSVPRTFANYNDWRLPTLHELNTIIDRNRVNPAIDTTIFQNKTRSGGWSGQWYWTADRAVWHDKVIVAIDFYSGSICGLDSNPDEMNYVRLVRG